MLNICRDMKPENVLIGRSERMKENVLHVVDFGLQSHRKNEHWMTCDDFYLFLFLAKPLIHL